MDRLVYQRMAEIDAEHWWFAARRSILSDLIRRYVSSSTSDPRILEIGCGTGHNLAMLSGHGHVEATELDDEARALAGARLGREVKNAALPDLSCYQEESFDLIALLDVLEHVEDDVGALAAIRTRLKPGGILLLTVPANPWMWSSHDEAHHHYRRYRKRDLHELFRTSRISPVLLSYFNTLLFPLIAAARVAAKAMGRGGSQESIPPQPVNSALRWIFSRERTLLGRIPFPIGVSFVAILRKPTETVG